MGAMSFAHKTDMVLTRQFVIFPPCERSKPRYCVGNQSLRSQLHITASGRANWMNTVHHTTDFEIR